MDVGELAGAVLPYVGAAATAYGTAVVQRVTEQAGDATVEAGVGVGRRVLRRLFGSSRGQQVREAVTELGEQPDDEVQADLLRAQIRKALAGDPQLVAEIAEMLADAEPANAAKYSVMITGSQGVQVGDRNTQTNTFGAPPVR